MTFDSRHLRVTIALKSGSFEGQGKNDTIIMEGYRTSVNIQNAGGRLASGSATVRIWGLRPDLMNQIYMLQAPVKSNDIRPNAIRIEAKEGEGEYVTVFEGQVYYCTPDYNAAPNVYMQIEARACAFLMWHVPPPNSKKGTQKVADLIGAIAQSVSLQFKNNGVTETVTDAYVSGSAINQMRELARAAGVMIDIDRGAVTIWPNGRGNGSPVIDLSPATGLVGYPKMELAGVTVDMLYNPNIDIGREVKLTTSISQLCGQWFVQQYHHMLDAELPNGKWFTSAFMTRLAYSVARN